VQIAGADLLAVEVHEGTITTFSLMLHMHGQA
jgi:hypothetical protein